MDLQELKTRLARLIADTPATTGLCVQIEDDAPLIMHNAEMRFSAASLIKLPIAYKYHGKCLSGGLSSQSVFQLQKEHWVDGCGVLKDAAPGSEFNLDHIAHVMLTQSDNVATNILIDMLGLEPINRTIGDLGMHGTSLQRKMYDFEAKARGLDNWITPGDVQAFLLRLQNPRPHERKICAYIIQTLKDQQLNHKLPALLPPGTPVAHKTGELTGVEHNAGIIYGPKRTCCITAMTQGLEDNSRGVDFCRQAGRLVYAALA